MISKLIKLPIFKRLIPSISLRLLKILNKNRGYFKINDFEMFLDFLDPIDRQIILSQEFEKQEIDFLINQIKLNRINYFLDVGANCGYYSLKISKEIPSIKILSFEPNIEAYSKFQKTLEKNLDLSKKIKLENFGLSDQSAKLKMQSMLKFGYAQTGGTSVINKNSDTKNFTFYANFKVGDDYIKLIDEKISIKIDVEGHELNVLKGIQNTIKKNHCILQIEVFINNFENVNNFLSSLGYKNFYEVKNRSNYFYKNFI
ncbi:FkbM family methyltransferase [Candidatus Pelagibacter sp.]|nr:FkbM family methyltransferase [Candidatus Pelagibacter sp.]